MYNKRMFKRENQNPEEENTIPAEDLKEAMLTDAISNRVSDIHIEPTTNNLLIRFRIDGVLHAWARRPLFELEQFISHLKIISNLDITHHATPQEAHFVWAVPVGKRQEQTKSHVIDVRSSFFPTVFGEAVVLRILNRNDLLIRLEDLGFSDANDLQAVRYLINRPTGMVLVTGPAGSGKTTTLYSMLHELMNESRNIITLEDPVEYYLDLIRQSQIAPHLGYSFAVGIRSILRQDPDIIMVGEIRDFETAENAIRASLTGRLLLSTLHANSSVGTITRLLDMKIEKDMIAYSLSGVISQRLVRKVCEFCRENYRPLAEVANELGLSRNETFIHGKGCDKCQNTGFQGRVGIFEILKIDEELHRLIITEAPPIDIQKVARDKGLKTLREDGIQKIRSGITTPEEVLKVTS
ncbi:MAG: type II secretion system protein E [Parcubacteria group bacterium Gr01-1014_107]|nr:MAG: type II secretion system protein E [Parcubacteria group bacterium Gr01-1014_107]